MAYTTADTINIFQTDSAFFCNIDSLYIGSEDGYESYSWSTGATTQGIVVMESGLYWLVASDDMGSQVTDSVFVSLITADILQSDTLICYNDTAVLAVRQKLPECQVVYFPFNGDTKDYSGNGFDGFAFGATLVPDRYDRPRSALSFNGEDSYLLATLGNIQSTFAVAMWYWMPDTSSWSPENEYPTLFDYSDGQAFVQILGKNPDVISSGKLGKVSLNHRDDGTGSDNYTLESVSNPPFETWHHLYVVFDTAGAANEIWIDGVKQGQLVATGQVLPVNNFIFLGRTNTFQRDKSYFIGAIDDVNIYNCPLDSMEIQNLIQTGSVFNYRYSWDTGDTAAVIAVAPLEKTVYRATVTDGIHSCSDSITVEVNPKIELTLEQIDIGCPGEEKAKILAHVSGGTPPYTLEWDPVIKFLQGDTLALGLRDSVNYTLSVTDFRECRFDDTFEVDALPAPTVSFTFEPEEVYLQNPVVIFTSETENAASWSWDFGDGELSSQENPTHVFSKPETFSVVLRVTAENGCTDSTAQEIDIKEVELTIPNVFTPNGDGVNDTFVVTDLDKYISNKLVIFNRWGNKVYEKNNYISGEWDGDRHSDGVYFYLLRCEGYFSTDEFRGTLNIFTGGLR